MAIYDSERAGRASDGWVQASLILIWPMLLLALVTCGLALFKIWYFDAALSDLSIAAAPDYGLLYGVVLAGCLPLLASFDARGDARQFELPAWAVLFAAAMLLGSIAATGIFTLSPSLFTALGKEDRPVEYASALAALAASVLFLSSLRRCPEGPYRNLARLWLGGLSLVLFLLAGEEISWGQRILGFGTPEMFAANIQNETNLHNFATWTVTTAYYAGGFVLLILVPFLIRWWQEARVDVSDYLPSMATALVAAPLVAFEYNRFGTVISEVMLVSTVLILAIWLSRAPSGPVRILLAALIPTIVLMPMIFLFRGETFLRGWDATEYRELLIAAGFLAFAVEVRLRLRRKSAA